MQKKERSRKYLVHLTCSVLLIKNEIDEKKTTKMWIISFCRFLTRFALVYGFGGDEN